jgi:hypothetical protein
MAQPNQQKPADDRIRRDNSPQTRGDKNVEDVSRSNETGLTDNLEDIEKMLASEFDQVALPTPPRIPGWHLCWLTTGSQYDSVQKRQRLGYIPVTASEVPSFETGGAASAQFEGAITCNEMVLFKIRDDRYQAIMKMFHHTRPLNEEQSIYERAMAQTGEEDSSGRRLGQTEGDGFTQLGKNIAVAQQGAPTFTP